MSAISELAEAPHEANADVQVLLDEEIGRLPDQYRIAVVLCDLEGRTRKEAESWAAHEALLVLREREPA